MSAQDASKSNFLHTIGCAHQGGYDFTLVATTFSTYKYNGQEVGREEGSGLLSHGPAGELGDWDAEGSEML